MATGTILPVITRVQSDGNGFAALVQDAKRAGDQVRQQFDRDFKEIGRLAQQALATPRNQAGSLDLNAGQYREAAQDARAYATALREVANASVTAARESGDTSEATRRYIQAARAASLEADTQARELTQTAQTYERLQQAINQTKSATDRVVQSTQRGTSALGAVTNSVRASRVAYTQLGQQMTDVVVQAQMGTSALTIFTQQVPQAAFALSGLGGTVGTVARVLSGPFGAALIGAVALLGPLIYKLTQTGEAMDEVKFASFAMGDAQGILGNVLDITTGKINTQNSALIALAKAQLLVAQVQSRTREAEARTGLQGVGSSRSTIFGGGAGGGLTLGSDSTIESQIAKQVLAGTVSSDRALDKLTQLLDRGRISDSRFNEVATYIANLGVERENQKVYEQGLELLEGTGGRNLLKPKPDRKKKGDGGAEREAREAARLAEFAETAAARVAQMRDAFSETPPAIARANSAMAQLNDLSSDLAEQVRRGLDPKIAAGLRAEIEALRPIIEQSINKPFNDLIESYQERAAIDELLIQNRQVEAEVLSRVLDLARNQGKISDEMIADLREQVVQERLRTSELEKQNELRQREVDLIEDTRDNLRDTFQSLSRGGGLGSIGTLFKRQFDILRTNVIDNLFENLFGDFFRNEKDKALGFDKVKEASERQVTSINTVSDALDRMAQSVTDANEQQYDLVAGERIPIPRLAANDNYDPNAEIVVEGARGSKKGGGAELSKMVSPRDFLSTALTAVADIFLDKATAEKIGQGIAGGLTKGQGAGYGMLASGMVLGQNGSPLGSAIGGALGEKFLGKAIGKGLESISSSLGSLGGPLGGIIGGLAGGLIGGLMTSTPRASSTIGGVDGSLGVVSTRGNSGSLRRASSGAAGEAIDSLERIADALGATINAANGSVSIGVRKGNFRVDTSGQGITKTSKGAIDFGEDSAAAIRAATLDLIKDGVLEGLRQSTQNLLKQAEDLDAAIQKALDFESIFTRLKEFKDPIGAALDALDKEFNRLIRIAEEANASGEEMAQLEELYGLERAEIFKDMQERMTGSLRDFVKSLEIGDSGLSLRDRLANARTAFDPLAATLRAGGQVDYDAFTEAAQDYLGVARELYGSQQEYFEVFNDILNLSKKALEDQENVVSIGTGRPSPFDQPSIDNVPVVEAVDAQSQMILSQTSSTNDLLREIADLIKNGGLPQAVANAPYF